MSEPKIFSKMSSTQFLLHLLALVVSSASFTGQEKPSLLNFIILISFNHCENLFQLLSGDILTAQQMRDSMRFQDYFVSYLTFPNVISNQIKFTALSKPSPMKVAFSSCRRPSSLFQTVLKDGHSWIGCKVKVSRHHVLDFTHKTCE